METEELTNNMDELHNRTIIHTDIDYFYAQVEEIYNPTFKDKPLGVYQKNLVVTSNYNARKYGIKKLITINDAKKLCPQLILVNGEDLTKYKQISSKIFDILLKYSPLVEKLGLDENYLDVSDLVNERIKNNYYNNNNNDNNKNENILPSLQTLNIEGCIYPLNGNLDSCNCGCSKRLTIGTYIAQDIRKELYEKLKITCSAGIAHNKLLAKLVGNTNKPNNQTVLVPLAAESFMRDLGEVKQITGIGTKTQLLLSELGIKNIIDLQNCDINTLKKKFDYESACKYKELSFGKDTTIVRTTGKPKSIGLEDSCRPISVRKDVEEKFRLLLMRLINQVSEDGRIPITIKVILRKYDAVKKSSHRETKQANISPSLFKYYQNQIMLSEGAQDKLIKIIMKLFERVIDMNKPFNITLLGLAFSKFQERKQGSSSIANFLIKKSDLEVQSITSLKSDGIVQSNTTSSTTQLTKTQYSNEQGDEFYRRRTIAPSPVPMLIDTESISSDISDFSETEIEPSPKKSRLGLLFAKRRCLPTAINDTNDLASPSKLRVADLRLNSRDSEKDSALNITNTASNSITLSISTNNIEMKIVNNHTNSQNNLYSLNSRISNYNNDYNSDSIESLCSHNSEKTRCNGDRNNHLPSISSINSKEEFPKTPKTLTTITGNVANIPCPSGVDQNIFKELPIDVQSELISSWRNSLAVKANNSSSTNNISNSNIATNNNTGTAGTPSSASGSGSNNTLHRYFIKNS